MGVFSTMNVNDDNIWFKQRSTWCLSVCESPSKVSMKIKFATKEKSDELETTFNFNLHRSAAQNVVFFWYFSIDRRKYNVLSGFSSECKVKYRSRTELSCSQIHMFVEIHKVRTSTALALFRTFLFLYCNIKLCAIIVIILVWEYCRFQTICLHGSLIGFDIATDNLIIIRLSCFVTKSPIDWPFFGIRSQKNRDRCYLCFRVSIFVSLCEINDFSRSLSTVLFHSQLMAGKILIARIGSINGTEKMK